MVMKRSLKKMAGVLGGAIIVESVMILGHAILN